MARTKYNAKRPWYLPVSIVAVILVILAIVIPLAIIMPRRNKSHNRLKATVLFPLYIYPTNISSWGPLYDSVQAHPHLNFTVIVNPSSGPGSTQYPDDQYSASLQKLNGFPNVETVGYVRTGYASRNISTVVSEVATYAGWTTKSNALAMHGIFFDEAPHEYSPDAVQYMSSINLAVKNSTGLLGAKTIIHNPGTIPDTHYNDSNTDVTVVFEDSYPAYQAAQTKLSALPARRANYSYMINAVPTMSLGNLGKLVDQLSLQAEYLFLTTLDQDFYKSWGQQWANFTSLMPT